ncbi:MAG: hypothetical protein ACLP1X_31150, partial [Polyangiaceae bacterium]
MSPSNLIDPALPVVVTLWASRTRPVGRHDPHTWASFVETFVARPEMALKKESVAGFALTSFRDNRRALSNVEFVFALMFDLDEDDVSIEQAARLWRRTRGVIYTTYSSTPDHPKLRIIIALSRPVSPEEHGRLWCWAAKRFARAKIVLDESTRDASRLWYVPSHRLGGAYEWVELRGRTLAVDRVLSLVRPPAALRPLPGGAQKGTTGARRTGGQRGQEMGGARRVPATQTFFGRAFELADMALRQRTNGILSVECPWAAEHTSGGFDDTSTVILPATSDAGWGLFKCSHGHCARRETLDLLGVLPAAALDAARRAHGSGLLRVTVVRAMFDTRPAWDARPPLVRWRLDLATRDGELLRANVVLPSPGYERASETFGAVFPG